MKISDRQAKYILLIAEYFEENDRFPTLAYLAEALGVHQNGPAEMLTRLQRSGIVARNKARKYKRGPMWAEAMAQIQEKTPNGTE